MGIRTCLPENTYLFGHQFGSTLKKSRLIEGRIGMRQRGPTKLGSEGLAAFAIALLAFGAAHGESVSLNPVADNTIFQGSGGGDNFEDNSCGAGTSVYSGRTDNAFFRRALLKFDIAGNIPAGATITSATLTMVVTRSRDNQNATMTLRR
ncbi:MAG: DNRLRE domain-containing protein, partial [Gammaproteobacteria bacterium]|nr:DNRLRE domain-containing protein [Gammaproteobacteria bacterium]